MTGPAARVIQAGPGEPVAEISPGAPEPVRWITQRGGWARGDGRSWAWRPG